jgi:hypothetical protein
LPACATSASEKPPPARYSRPSDAHADQDWLDGEPAAGRELEDHDEDQGADVPGAANLDHHRGGPEAE